MFTGIRKQVTVGIKYIIIADLNLPERLNPYIISMVKIKYPKLKYNSLN